MFFVSRLPAVYPKNVSCSYSTEGPKAPRAIQKFDPRGEKDMHDIHLQALVDCTGPLVQKVHAGGNIFAPPTGDTFPCLKKLYIQAVFDTWAKINFPLHPGAISRRKAILIF